MKNKEFLNKICRWIVAIFLPIVLILTILQGYAFNAKFYLTEFEKYDIPAVTQIEMKDLEKITVRIIDYLKNEEKDLNIQMKINNQIEEVFGEREKQHMVDVKALFRQGFLLRNFGFLFVLSAFTILLKRKKTKEFFKGSMYASIISLAAMLWLFILMQIDFFKYFTYFHEIFFNNDLWLLDPKTDVLIQMLPLEFFTDIATSVVGWFIASMVLVGGLSFYIIRKLKNE
ncbi:MAG: TIGR01906 family membrane protein [Bacillota bacterium]